MTAALIFGGLAGFGVFGLIKALFPARPGLTRSLSLYDSVARKNAEEARSERTRPASDEPKGLQAEVGKAMARLCEARGWEQRSVRADLALLDQSYETYLATKVLLPAVALAFTPILVLAAATVAKVSVTVPLWGGLLIAVMFFFFPDLQVKQDAARLRADFRHVVGAFLDLVSMNLAGGRGVPEALMSASQIGDGWAMRRIREALANARISGKTPWQALGLLGEEINVAELRDLSAALTLVADDGAKIRQSLGARAASMRSREISDIEGKAGERSQSMLVAQLLFCLAFLIFLLFPALTSVLTRTQ